MHALQAEIQEMYNISQLPLAILCAGLSMGLLAGPDPEGRPCPQPVTLSEFLSAVLLYNACKLSVARL